VLEADPPELDELLELEELLDELELLLEDELLLELDDEVEDVLVPPKEVDEIIIPLEPPVLPPHPDEPV
jgi:hypothetical protein